MGNQNTLARAFEALADPMRRRILERLGDGPVAVGQLADALPIGRPAVSRHLRVLATAGLVHYTSRGTRNLYALAPDGKREVQQWLVTLWDDAIASVADFVEPTSDVTKLPAVAHPVTASPITTKPVTTMPVTSKPATTKPVKKKSKSSGSPGKAAKKKPTPKRKHH